MTTPAQRHVPVLLERCVALLAPAMTDPGSVLVAADSEAAGAPGRGLYGERQSDKFQPHRMPSLYLEAIWVVALEAEISIPSAIPLRTRAPS